jgi:hypothetical protein
MIDKKDFENEFDEPQFDEKADMETLYDWDGSVITEMTLDQLKNYIKKMKENELLTISF